VPPSTALSGGGRWAEQQEDDRYDAPMIGDHDRERCVSLLREHYACGRLTLEEFSSRSDLVLASRSYGELRRAFADLPAPFRSANIAASTRSLGRAVVRGALLMGLTCAYVAFSFMLLLVLALTLVLHDATGSVVVGLLVVWLVPTYLLSRMWRRAVRLWRAAI
jgi:hypothetical protein